MRRSLFRHTLLGACLSAPFLLAGCSSDEGVPQNFPPLRYTYLAPISLNVSSIQTEVAYAPTDDGTSLDAMSPEAPIQAVEQMLQDRLVASGAGGTATVTINTASLNRVNDTAVGNISVQVAVISADGRRSGYTTASVTRTRTLPDDTSDSALRAFLYQMTSDLVNAENVELEYQIRQHLADWLVGGTSPIVGGPAAPAPVEAQPLGGPGAPALSTPALSTPALGAPMPLGAPAPASLSVPSAAPAAMPAMPTPPLPGQPQPNDTTPTMPSGDLGLPQGNPVPQDVSPVAPVATPGGPVPLTPTAPAPAPGAPPSPAYQLVPSQPPASSAPAAASAAPAPPPAAPAAPASTPAPAPSVNPATLPPLPPTITP